MNLRRVQNLNRRAIVRRLADLSREQETAMPAAWWILRALEQGERRTLADRRTLTTRQQANKATH
jgi:hypothetical protein